MQLVISLLMAGDPQYPNDMFKGWRYYFNTYTIKGRSTVSIIFLACYFSSIKEYINNLNAFDYETVFSFLILCIFFPVSLLCWFW